MNKPTILRLIKYLSISFLSLVIAAIVLGGGVFFYYVSKAPSLSESKLVATTSSKIYDNKNQLIADLGSERRVNAQANDIPTDLVKAIVSIEDHRFFDHRGLIPSVSWELSCAICKVIPSKVDQLSPNS